MPEHHSRDRRRGDRDSSDDVGGETAGPFDPSLPDLPFDDSDPIEFTPPTKGRKDRRTSVIDARSSGLERRRGPGRRLSDFVKAAEEGEMTREQFLFLRAIEAFKTANNKSYPNWTDVLEVVRLLGYRKTVVSELSLTGVEDWTERADAKSNVRTRDGVRHTRSKKKAA